MDNRSYHEADQSQLPVCQLHGTRISELPAGCPLRRRDALNAVAELRDRGWAELGRREPDHAAALADLHRVDVCGGCVGRLAGHPLIRRLRRATSLSLADRVARLERIVAKGRV